MDGNRVTFLLARLLLRLKACQLLQSTTRTRYEVPLLVLFLALRQVIDAYVYPRGRIHLVAGFTM